MRVIESWDSRWSDGAKLGRCRDVHQGGFHECAGGSMAVMNARRLSATVVSILPAAGIAIPAGSSARHPQRRRARWDRAGEYPPDRRFDGGPAVIASAGRTESPQWN